MTFQYIDGINDLFFHEGTVRGTLVVIESGEQAGQNTEGLNSQSATEPTIKIVKVGSLMTSVRGAVQIHSALDQLIKKLIKSGVLKAEAKEESTLKASSQNSTGKQ
jgi:hypothetical protein